jgi:hypothetical protein
MKKYYVLIREVHVSTRLVEAASVEEAIHEAGGAEEVMCEYSHTLDTDTWSVEDEDGNTVRDQL